MVTSHQDVVRELVGACRQAIADGNDEEARELARLLARVQIADDVRERAAKLWKRPCRGLWGT